MQKTSRMIVVATHAILLVLFTLVFAACGLLQPSDSEKNSQPDDYIPLEEGAYWRYGSYTHRSPGFKELDYYLDYRNSDSVYVYDHNSIIRRKDLIYPDGHPNPSSSEEVPHAIINDTVKYKPDAGGWRTAGVAALIPWHLPGDTISESFEGNNYKVYDEHDVTITVGAGTFKHCVHIHKRVVVENFPYVTDSYYAVGVGLVLMTGNTGVGYEFSQELLEYSLTPDVTDTPLRLTALGTLYFPLVESKMNRYSKESYLDGSSTDGSFYYSTKTNHPIETDGMQVWSVTLTEEYTFEEFTFVEKSSTYYTSINDSLQQYDDTSYEWKPEFFYIKLEAAELGDTLSLKLNTDNTIQSTEWVLSMDSTIAVPAGTFDNCAVTKLEVYRQMPYNEEGNWLDTIFTTSFYAPSVGLVSSETVWRQWYDGGPQSIWEYETFLIELE